MGVLGILLVFVIVWWIIWFMTLSFGVKTPDTPEPGHVASAPEKPRLWIKAAVTTLIAAAITGIIVGVVEMGWLTIEDIAE